MLESNNEYEVYSTYQMNQKTAVVVKHRVSGSWGVHMSQDNKAGLLEYYPTHSEAWAENVAENFVEGIKQL